VSGALAAPAEAPRTDDRLTRAQLAVFIAGFVALAAGVVALRTRFFFPIGMGDHGSRVGNFALAMQFAALAGGMIALHLRGDRAREILAVEGALCLAGFGVAGAAYALGLLAFFFALSASWLGRARPLVGLALLAGMNALAWAGRELSVAAAMFSLIFTMRLMMFGWDRWQNDFARAELRDFLAYVLIAPLIVIPPYMTIIPFFSGFTSRLKPGLTGAILRRAGKHLAWCALFGGARAGIALSHFDPQSQPLATYFHFLCHVLDAATFAHLLIPLLLLHGIDERLPIDKPALATRFIFFWNRFQVHQKDAQVFLFFTPALLKLRRKNRYVALIAATTWTMMFGNTFIHVVARYCFLPAPWERLEWVLFANVVMTVALSIDMCWDEWKRRHPSKQAPRFVPARKLAGWAVTQTLGAIATL
jgi:hypothetical protein